MQSVPVFLKLMIDFVSTKVEEEPTWKGYLYMACIMALNFAKTLTVSWYFYLVSTAGLRIRTALTCAIYSKALKLSPSARKTTTGSVVRLRSNTKTATNFYLLFQLGKQSISCPSTPKGSWI